MAMLVAASADKHHTHGNSLRRKLGQLARRHKNLEIMTTEPVYLGDFADLVNLKKPLSLFEARKWARANRQHPLLAPYFQPGGVRAHVDHIVPRRWGGLDHARNYMLMPDVVNSSFREFLDNEKLAYIGSTAARKAAAFCKYAREHMTKCSLFRDMPELPVAGLHVTSSGRAHRQPQQQRTPLVEPGGLGGLDPDSLWHAAEVSSDPGSYFKQLLGLMRELEPLQQQQLLERSRQAPATSLLSKLAWQEMWPGPGEFDIKPMELCVRMQRFALSIKEKPLLKLKDCRDEIRAFFTLAPTKYFWLDLRDVLSRWWVARTGVHLAMRSCTLREVLVGPPLLVERTELVKLRLLSQEYKQQGLELIPLDWAMRYKKKPNIFKLWEQHCAEPIDTERLQRLLWPTPAPPPASPAPQVPEWLAGMIRGCFEASDGDFFASWLAQRFRTFRGLQEQQKGKLPLHPWLCLQGQVTPWLRQLLRSFCLALGDQHVVVLRDLRLEPHKLAELQQGLLVVIDGCSRRRSIGQELQELLQLLRSDLKIPGSGWGDIFLRNRSQVLILPNDDGKPLWTASQLQWLGVAATSLRLSGAVRGNDDDGEQQQGCMPSPQELGRFLETMALPAAADDAGDSAPVLEDLESAYKKFSPFLRRTIALKTRLPCKKRRAKIDVPHVYPLRQGPNAGKFILRLQDLVGSFESFSGLAKGELSKSAREQFLACFKKEFPLIDLKKPNAQSMYSSLGRNGPKVHGLLFPYTKNDLVPKSSSPKRERDREGEAGQQKEKKRKTTKRLA